MEKSYIFNVYTGELYQINKSELNNILEGEIPILKKPNTNCKRCFGRGYESYDTTKRSYTICYKCVDKELDRKYLKEIKYVCLVPSKLAKKDK